MELVVDGVVLLIDDADYNMYWKYFSCLQYQHGRAGKVPCAVRLYMHGTYVLLHRAIMNPPVHLVVDHINGNPFDNRRENLRLCTYAANRWNSKTPQNKLDGRLPKGIYKRKDGGKYRVSVTANGIKYDGGSWDSLEDAVKSLDLLHSITHMQFKR